MKKKYNKFLLGILASIAHSTAVVKIDKKGPSANIVTNPMAESTQAEGVGAKLDLVERSEAGDPVAGKVDAPVDGQAEIQSEYNEEAANQNTDPKSEPDVNNGSANSKVQSASKSAYAENSSANSKVQPDFKTAEAKNSSANSKVQPDSKTADANNGSANSKVQPDSKAADANGSANSKGRSDSKTAYAKNYSANSKGKPDSLVLKDWDFVKSGLGVSTGTAFVYNESFGVIAQSCIAYEKLNLLLAPSYYYDAISISVGLAIDFRYSAKLESGVKDAAKNDSKDIGSLFGVGLGGMISLPFSDNFKFMVIASYTLFVGDKLKKESVDYKGSFALSAAIAYNYNVNDFVSFNVGVCAGYYTDNTKKEDSIDDNSK